ncbi:ribosome biogenesis GTP-binding protein YihA/YsxC [Alphaproteobacteria bacterium]|nr:ribosome biogenesis GTP-binding protein YihA/YsxC [Alphaproteobacteria bacterium]
MSLPSTQKSFKLNDFNPEIIKIGRKLFSQPCVFSAGVNNSEQLPNSSIPEIAFAGRSNVGKSSLLNTLTNRSNLARVSQTPGCTKQLNFFNLNNEIMICDLPGYGYAKISKKERLNWDNLIIKYLKGRALLQRVLLLIDIRRGLKDSDEKIMKILTEAAVVFEVILTKVDKVSPLKYEKLILDTEKKISTFTTAYPRVLMTSSNKKQGIDSLRAEIAQIIMNNVK